MNNFLHLAYIITIIALLVTGNVLLSDRQKIVDKQSEKIYDLRIDRAKLKGQKIGYKNLLKGYMVCSDYTVELTAYTARPEETNWDYTNTAIMEEPVPGWSIAVSQDLKHLLGKRVYIEGFGVRYVNDLMNKRYEKRVDILVPSVVKARNIGLKKDVQMVLIEPRKLFLEILEWD